MAKKKVEQTESKEKIPFLEWFNKNKSKFKDKTYSQIINLYIEEFNCPKFVYYGYEQYFMPGRCLYPLSEHLICRTQKNKKN